MKVLRSFSTLLIVIILGLGCQSKMKFEKIAWKKRDDLNSYINRDKMLDDLLRNYKLKGIKYGDLITLIGKPDHASDSTMNYEIILHYDMIDPDHMKNLFFTFDQDSIITSYEIREWDKHH